MNYRLYVLTNMYLSSIQKGIQTAHVVGELFIQPHDDTGISHYWARNNKTIIVLNGGNHLSLLRMYTHFQLSTYTCALFREDENSLRNAVTAIGIILPENVWSGKSKNRTNRKIYNMIKDLPLAI